MSQRSGSQERPNAQTAVGRDRRSIGHSCIRHDDGQPSGALDNLSHSSILSSGDQNGGRQWSPGSIGPVPCDIAGPVRDAQLAMSYPYQLRPGCAVECHTDSAEAQADLRTAQRVSLPAVRKRFPHVQVSTSDPLASKASRSQDIYIRCGIALCVSRRVFRRQQ